ncbi:unnamed protein product, partial [Medioppia subpectinata]
MHCVQAFIAETLRYRTAAPVGSPRVTLCDTTIAGKYAIANNTIVLQHSYNMLLDDHHWSHANQFDPGRFQYNGQFVKPRSTPFMPFGSGR